MEINIVEYKLSGCKLNLNLSIFWDWKYLKEHHWNNKVDLKQAVQSAEKSLNPF